MWWVNPSLIAVRKASAARAMGNLPRDRTFFLSTEGILRHIGESPASEFAVGTEIGILHQLAKKYPENTFFPVNPNAVCAFMKTITLDRVIRSLETFRATDWRDHFVSNDWPIGTLRRCGIVPAEASNRRANSAAHVRSLAA